MRGKGQGLPEKALPGKDGVLLENLQLGESGDREQN